MQALWDDLFCQLFHSRWAREVSYSRAGRWSCEKPNCRAQQRWLRTMASQPRPIVGGLKMMPSKPTAEEGKPPLRRAS